MIQQGADVNCVDIEKHSVLHWAVVCGELDILILLYNSGADLRYIYRGNPVFFALGVLNLK